jgi:cyclohexanone monooxygenase
MDTFKGHSFHTSRWDYAYTGPDLSLLAGKVVGIIGTGASAVQIIPHLGAAAKELYVFQRTPSSIDIRDDWETDPAWAAALKPGWQAERRARALARPPFGILPIDDAPGMSVEEQVRRQENANIEYMLRIHQRIDEIVDDPETAEALKPWYMFMCKRPCFHNDYLPTFNRPNVHLVDTRGQGITQISEKGPVVDGREYELDLLIYATGFDVLRTGLYNRIVGEGGVEINDKYRTGVRTLLGIHSHGFPNLFIMGGLQASFQFNLTDVLQAEGDHIAACIDHVRRRGGLTIDVTPEAEAWWVDEVIACRGRIMNNPDCTPGYYNAYGGSTSRQDRSYDGGFPQYLRHMDEIRAEPDRYFRFT